MKTYLLIACLFACGCGSRVIGEGNFADGDAGPDAVSVDSARDTGFPIMRDSGTKPPPDIGPDPEGCATRLSSDFRCTAPDPSPGRKVCNDVAIRAVVDGCFGETATSDSCEAAQTKYGACSSCMLYDWLVDGTRLAIAQCMQKIDPKNSCVMTVECTYDCLDEVCSECGFGPELDDCWQSQAETQCAKHVADYTACISDPKLSVCYPTTVEDVVPFYRGACRDGGNWSRAYEPDAVDAGSSGG